MGQKYERTNKWRDENYIPLGINVRGIKRVHGARRVTRKGHILCVRALCIKDKRGIFNIMRKSTSMIFIGTGRLTVEDEFCLILSINYKADPRGVHGAIHPWSEDWHFAFSCLGYDTCTYMFKSLLWHNTFCSVLFHDQTIDILH